VVKARLVMTAGPCGRIAAGEQRLKKSCIFC
jgi:hypothetical protein